MTHILSAIRPQLAELCRQYRVKSLSVTGSAVRADFDATSSDIDLVVEFLPMTPREHKRAYFGLLEAVEELTGRSVDLIELQAVRNPYVLESIARHREALYDVA